MTWSRRRFLTSTGSLTAGIAGAGTLSGCGGPDSTAAISSPSASADDPRPRLSIAARSPWMSNQVALTSDNDLFLGMPRFPGHETTPSVGHRGSDGTVVPFPGNSWNEWKRGDNGKDAFVYVNSVHVFADDTVWVVDQGGLRPDSVPKALSTPKPGAQKIVRLDRTGKVLDVLRFGDDILPVGAQMNDVRIHGTVMYVTDSGLGGIIVHDLMSGTTRRRLSGYKEMLAVESPPPAPTASATGSAQNKHKTPKSDMIELTRDGKWLYWAAPTGPLRRVRTAYVRDASLSDKELATHVEKVADIPLSGGCAIDTLGNFYLSDIDNKRVLVMPPSGRKTVLVASNGLISPDGSFISADRHLYVPAPQTELTKLFGNAKDLTRKPFLIYSLALPKSFDGIELGDAVNGDTA